MPRTSIHQQVDNGRDGPIQSSGVLSPQQSHPKSSGPAKIPVGLDERGNRKILQGNSAGERSTDAGLHLQERSVAGLRNGDVHE